MLHLKIKICTNKVLCKYTERFFHNEPNCILGKYIPIYNVYGIFSENYLYKT